MNLMNNPLKVTNRVFYVQNTNINYSFKSIEKLGKKYGADLQVGDIVVIDNHNRNKRKMLKKAANGWIIMYGACHPRTEFFPLSKRDGLVRKKTRELEYNTKPA